MNYRILVTGTRHNLTSEHQQIIVGILTEALDTAAPFAPVVVHGACPTGVDAFVDNWCAAQGVSVERYPADWYGPCDDTCYHRPRAAGAKCPAAGPRRNQSMVDDGADIVLAFPYGVSKGTRGCAKYATESGVRTVIIELKE